MKKDHRAMETCPKGPSCLSFRSLGISHVCDETLEMIPVPALTTTDILPLIGAVERPSDSYVAEPNETSELEREQ